MPADANTTRLRESMVEFYEIFNRAKSDSIFEGLVQEVPAELGFFKPAALALPGQPSAFSGTATVHTIDSRSKSYDTIVYEYTWQLDKNLIMRTDAASRGMVSRMLRGIASKWVGHRDRKLTTLLATCETTGGLDGNAIVGNTVATLDGSITVDNQTATAVSGSADEVLSATHEALGLFETMRNTNNDLAKGNAPRVKLMFDPVGQTDERKFVYDGLKPMLLNDEYKFADTEVVLQANGYLGGNPDLFFFDLDTPDKYFVCGVEQDADFVTTLGSQGDGFQILYRKHLGQTSYVYECAFSGNPYGMVHGNDA